MKILLFDNYDSFTFNLYHYISSLNVYVDVVRNDKITSKKIIKMKYQKIVISPGPGNPNQAGNCINIVKSLHKNIPSKFEATRYHSLIIDKKTLSKNLEITAETEDGTIMGIQHKKYNIHGVQFHPESIKTPIGIKILKNFINYKK